MNVYVVFPLVVLFMPTKTVLKQHKYHILFVLIKFQLNWKPLYLGESDLNEAITEAGKTYEEIASLVAEQVGLL